MGKFNQAKVGKQGINPLTFKGTGGPPAGIMGSKPISPQQSNKNPYQGGGKNPFSGGSGFEQ